MRAAEPGPLRLVVLSRDHFLTAVVGYSASAAAGEQTVSTRLAQIDELTRR